MTHHATDEKGFITDEAVAAAEARGFTRPTLELAKSLKHGQRVRVIWATGAEYVARVDEPEDRPHDVTFGLFKLRASRGHYVYVRKTQTAHHSEWPLINTNVSSAPVAPQESLANRLLESQDD